MLRYFIKHQYLSFRRSAGFEREIAIKVVLGIFLLYMIANLIFIAFMLPKFLGKGEKEAFAVINSILFYYFLGELIFRYLIQTSPALELQNYLHLPIKKSRISAFLQFKSLLHPLNFLSALVTGPLAFKTIAPVHGLAAAWSWWLSVIFFSLTLHFLMLLFRKKWEDSIRTWIIIGLVAVITYLLDYYNIINPSTLFATLFNQLVEVPVLFLIFPAILGTTVYFSYKFFKNNFYLEDLTSNKISGENYSARMAFLSSYGITGEMILQEIKLIIRHKRSKSFIFMAILFLPYGLIFMDDYTGGFSPILVFLGVFITGIFSFQYGQMLWGWKTNLLDFYFTRPFYLNEIVKGQYRFLSMTCIFYGLLTIPYVYFGWEVLFAFMCCMVFNIGISIPLMMAMAMWKPSAMDINKSAFMNYQGIGPAQWLMMIPVMVLPFLLYFIISWIFSPFLGFGGLAVIGFLSLIFNKLIINLLTRRLQSFKYVMVQNLKL